MRTVTLSPLQRCWLHGIRLAWQHRGRPDAAIGLIDRLMRGHDLVPAGRSLVALVDTLEAEGARHLYFEQLDTPGLTGDEQDLLDALSCGYRDNLFGSDHALGALLPPDRSDRPLRLVEAIAALARIWPRCPAQWQPPPAVERRVH